MLDLPSDHKNLRDSMDHCSAYWWKQLSFWQVSHLQ